MLNKEKLKKVEEFNVDKKGSGMVSRVVFYKWTAVIQKRK